jgi:hypothetical protein
MRLCRSRYSAEQSLRGRHLGIQTPVIQALLFHIMKNLTARYSLLPCGRERERLRFVMPVQR